MRKRHVRKFVNMAKEIIVEAKIYSTSIASIREPTAGADRRRNASRGDVQRSRI